MRSLSYTFSARTEPERDAREALSFRSVALLFPPKDVLERVRKNSNDVDTARPNDLDFVFDESNETRSPSDEDLRVIIAQDDSGVSNTRLLFDSQSTKTNDSHASRNTPRIALMRDPTTHVAPKTSSAFIRPQRTRPSSPILSAPKPGAKQPPKASGFVQSSQSRRLPPQVSLADARNDPSLPIMNTTEEMNSWLDCLFGKSQMRYKGDMVKIHILERQPEDPTRAHWERESQRGGFALVPEANGPLPKSRPQDLVKLRKTALLISKTFAVPIYDEDLPEEYRTHVNNSAGSEFVYSKNRCQTPLFGIAMILPLGKPCDADFPTGATPEDSSSSVKCLSTLRQTVCSSDDPIQVVIDNWHIVSRALNGLQATAKNQIQMHLQSEVAQRPQSYIRGLSTAPRLLRLRSNVFDHSEVMTDASELAISRIDRSSHIFDVLPQGQWNVWRDNVRELSRSRDAKTGKVLLDTNRANFIQLSLTAALSLNTSWLRRFAPPHHQTRLLKQQHELQNSYDAAQNRIVIVSTEQNRARSLLFVLAKFLPAAPQQFERSPPTSLRSIPKTSALTQGLKAASQVNLEVDTGNETAGSTPVPQALESTPVFGSLHEGSSGLSPNKKGTTTALEILSPHRISNAKMEFNKIRMPYERGTPAVPISAPGSSYGTPSGSPEARPGSAASAHDDLMRHLQRNDSANTSSTDSTSLWSSFRSNSWSLRLRRDSSLTEHSDTGLASNHREPGPVSILKGTRGAGNYGRSKLVRMAEDAYSGSPPSRDNRKDSAINTEDSTPPSLPTSNQPVAIHFNPPPSPSSKLQYSYNARLGLVDVTLPDAIPSEAPVQGSLHDELDRAPSLGTCFPVFGNLGASKPAREPAPQPTSHASYNRAAGYLESIHPDFVLQAVKPYVSLPKDIRAAMKSEPSPKFDRPPGVREFYPQEHWMSVCSTIIINAEDLSVTRVTLQRRVQYSIMSSDGVLSAPQQDIKIIKSEDMDSIKRTYRRNDQGKRIEWQDKKVVQAAQNPVDHQCDDSQDQDKMSVAELDVSNTNKKTNSTAASNVSKATQSTQQSLFGDDVSAFVNRKVNNPQENISAFAARTKRVPTRDLEGKMTGWSDVAIDVPEEPGVNDLPTGFSTRKQEKVFPTIYERTLEEVFKEETITKSDPAFTGILEQMLSESRSAIPSRASSVHDRTRSRSNSISGSGLTELQYESRKIVEDALEELVGSVASEAHTWQPTGSSRFLNILRDSHDRTETSILRQRIAEWLNSS